MVEQAVPELGHASAPRADIRVTGGPDAPLTYADVMVTHTASFSSSTGTWSPAAPGQAAAEAEKVKQRRYRPAAGGSSIRLVPLIWETHGRWGRQGMAELRRVARRRATVAASQGSADADAVYRATLNRWRREVSVQLQSWNAAILAASVGFAVDLRTRSTWEHSLDLIPEAH